MMMRFFYALIFALLSCWCSAAMAQESVQESQPIVVEAEELPSPSHGFLSQGVAALTPDFNIKESLKDAPAFFRDMSATLNLRNYYFAQSDAKDSPGSDKEKISWAQGGSLKLNSGKFLDVFSMRSELFTSQKLYGPKDKDGAKLLETGQEDYTVVGVINPRLEYEGNLLTLYRQRIDFPYVNSQENRMTPNTFEAYSYGYLGEGEAPLIQGGFGYINKIKPRNSEDFIYMSEAAGVAGSDKGTPWAGVRVRPLENLKITAVNYSTLDVLNIFYSEADYGYELNGGFEGKSSFQVSDQSSIGDDLLTGTNKSVGMWGMQQAVSYSDFLLRGAYTYNGGEMNLISPYGSYPGYTAGIVNDYNLAGQETWKLGIAYDFTKVGLPGVSFYSDYISGSGTLNGSGQPAPDSDEIDLNIDLKAQEGILKGFWLRLRGAFVNQQYAGWTQEYRVICNYEIPLF